MKSNNQNTQCYTIDFEFVPKAKKSFGREKLDTLAQSGTTFMKKPPLELSGIGSDISDKSVLLGRAKRKLITQKVVLSLIDYAKKKSDSEMEKAFWNTYHCLNKILVSNKKIFGRYCKNRFCTVCNSIRKAEMINKYLSTIQSWEEPYFVTLTAKSCYAKNLYWRMRNTKRAFKIIEERFKKRCLRGKGPKLVGIKSFECNFNPIQRWYNPHFHIIVPNKKIAVLLEKEWRKLWTKDFTSRDGQKIRKVENTERDLIEVVKYGSKILTEPNPNKKSKRKLTHWVYIAALYNILRAMRGLRLLDTFGFQLPNQANNENIKTKVQDYEELDYHPAIMDWINEETGETLSGFTPNQELMNLLNHRINTNLQ